MDIEDIRRNKLEQLKAQQTKQVETQEQFAQLEIVVKQYFTPDALTRYGNVRAAHQDTATKLIVTLAQLIQGGQLQQMITDEMLKKILAQLTTKHDIKITRI